MYENTVLRVILQGLEYYDETAIDRYLPTRFTRTTRR